MNLLSSLSNLFTALAIVLLAGNVGLALLLTRYLSQDKTDLPIKVNNVAEAAGALAAVYLGILTLVGLVLAFAPK